MCIYWESVYYVTEFHWIISSRSKGFWRTKCMSLNNELCIARSIFFNLNPEERYCYQLMVSLDRCNGGCNILDDSSSRIYVPNKTEDVNLNIFNMIARINLSKTLTKYIPYGCKCKFDGRKCNSNQKWNKELCWCECKNPIKHHECEEDYIWNPSIYTWEIGRYLKSIFGDSVVYMPLKYSRGRVVVWRANNFSQKITTCEIENFYILLAFLLITTSLSGA